jgi:hypothetical protein
MADLGHPSFGGCCAALVLQETEEPALVRPVCRQVSQPTEPRDSEIDGLAADQDGFHDIGCEKRRRQRAADIGPMDAMPRRKFVHGLCVAQLQFRDPSVCVCDQVQ